MERKIKLQRKDGEIEEGILKFLGIEYIDKIMKFQEKVYEGLENKDFFSCSPREEFEDMILKSGAIIGCVIEDTDELIAMGGYICYGEDENNYGYDLDITGEELHKVGQIEATIVDSFYRGNNLQVIMCKVLERKAKENGNTIISATAAPDNKYSVNNFLNLNYKIIKEKLKYGGLRRYIFKKEIKKSLDI